MGTSRKKAVRVTHAPSGESVTIPGDYASLRTESATTREMQQIAISVIRSRLVAEQIGAGRSTKEVACYDLPDGMEYPNDLLPFRSPPMSNEGFKP